MDSVNQCRDCKADLKLLGKGKELITYVQNRSGYDHRYEIDNTKITTELGWKTGSVKYWTC